MVSIKSVRFAVLLLLPYHISINSIHKKVKAKKEIEETITYLCHLPVLINCQFYIILSSIICNTTLKYDSGYDVGDYNNNNTENGNDMLKLMSVSRRVTMLVLRAGSWQSFFFISGFSYILCFIFG